MRFLFVTTVGSTMNFFIRLTEELIKEGHTVDLAANESLKAVPTRYDELGCRFYHISCSRSPFDFHNFQAVKELNKLVKDNKYDIVHCHTPIAGICARLACICQRKKGVKVFYTAHGFHFYKGAPVVNWIVYYPIEVICSFFTDTLITINKEDYNLAKQRLKSKKIVYIPGVGVAINDITSVKIDRNKKRDELGIPRNAIVLLSVGELNENKNHKVVIQAVHNIANDNIHYVIAGKGNCDIKLIELSRKLEIENRIHFLGFRRDIYDVYRVADVYILPSFREGLNVSIIEAMASGLPVICSNIRGNVDLIHQYRNGRLFNPRKIEELEKAIIQIIENENGTVIINNINDSENYGVELINNQMIGLYYS